MEIAIGQETLTEQDLHCIARLLQSAMFAGDNDNILAGCTFCKFQCAGADGKLVNFSAIRKKLSRITGVDIDYVIRGELEHSYFPYKKFLKNSNDEAKEYFRNFFSDI